eukprot:g37535.t1
MPYAFLTVLLAYPATFRDLWTSTPRSRDNKRIGASEVSHGLRYFGRSIHGQLDMNNDGLVDLAVGALGSAVQLWSRSIIQVNASMRFEPRKINIFNKDCKRNGKECSCMSVLVCFTVTAKSPGLQNDSL